MSALSRRSVRTRPFVKHAPVSQVWPPSSATITNWIHSIGTGCQALCLCHWSPRSVADGTHRCHDWWRGLLKRARRAPVAQDATVRPLRWELVGPLGCRPCSSEATRPFIGLPSQSGPTLGGLGAAMSPLCRTSSPKGTASTRCSACLPAAGDSDL